MFHVACKQEEKSQPTSQTPETASRSIPVHYAKGFRIEDFGSYTKIEVTAPWPGDQAHFEYLLVPKGAKIPKGHPNATVISVPVASVVVTSTTDIPILEYLNIEDKLTGFPNTAYISSKKTRARIDKNQVKDIGKEVALNTEMVMELAPELIIGFSATGDIKSYTTLQQAGIPVVMNGSWMEQDPLGRAEWIKFVAAFFDKENEARKAFKTIEKAYVKTAALATHHSLSSPTVLSGSLYKDVWYVPGGSSFLARIMKDAHMDYFWETDNSTGSLALSFESVLDKAQHAAIWLESGTPSTIASLLKANSKYGLFDAIQQKKVYSASLKKGPTGGLPYYEIGALRPDLILKDLIKIAHPQLLPDYELFFFKQLE